MTDRARLERVEHDRKITKETDGRFLFAYQKAVLLALKDSGGLDEAQYRYAEERLTSRFRAYISTQSGAEKEEEEP